ncbi:MAG: SDR family NAD(P)-dependent oxidoreductase [Pseudomonadota bacterium]
MSSPVRLKSFEPGLTAVVIGAGGGIGRAFVDHLANSPDVGAVHALSRAALDDAPARVTPHRADATIEDDLARVAGAIGAADLVIVASGVLHGDEIQPEKAVRQLDGAAMARVLAINTIAPALALKHFLPLLPRDRKAAFAALSARVGSISDNNLGGWMSYRASKAALNMVLRTAAIEWARRAPHGVIAGLHPGTVDTGLSKPFQRGVPDGKLFTPSRSAGDMLIVLDRLSAAETGRVFAYDGAEIPA